MVFRLFALIVTIAVLPTCAQVSGGTSNSVSADGVKAAFATQLVRWLSPESIRSVMARIREMPTGDATGLTNFDNVHRAPCAFIDTSALRGSEQFAVFQAPGNSGGALLSDCAGLGPAHSPPNYLAFYSSVTYGDGGVPTLPELIGVGRQRTSVSLWISGGPAPGYPIAIAAFGPAGMVGMVTTTTTLDWTQVTLAAAGIDAILLIGNPVCLLVDDIQSE